MPRRIVSPGMRNCCDFIPSPTGRSDRQPFYVGRSQIPNAVFVVNDSRTFVSGLAVPDKFQEASSFSWIRIK